jgi:hypothetical protein
MPEATQRISVEWPESVLEHELPSFTKEDVDKRPAKLAIWPLA